MRRGRESCISILAHTTMENYWGTSPQSKVNYLRGEGWKFNHQFAIWDRANSHKIY